MTTISWRGGAQSAGAVPRPRGFTLIELLVVVAIIAVVMSLILPALQSTVDRARIVACANNQRQIAVAHVNWANDHEGGLLMETPANPWRAYMVAAAPNNTDAYVKDCAAVPNTGMLYKGGYLAVPQSFYCPAWRPTSADAPKLAFRQYYGPVGGGPPGWRTEVGWSGNARRARCTYYLNPCRIANLLAPERGNTDKSTLTVDLSPAKRILSMDVIDDPNWSFFHLNRVVNVAVIDGSVRGYPGQKAWDLLIATYPNTAGDDWNLFYNVLDQLIR